MPRKETNTHGAMSRGLHQSHNKGKKGQSEKEPEGRHYEALILQQNWIHTMLKESVAWIIHKSSVLTIANLVKVLSDYTNRKVSFL